ncbi:SDR family oxidoreductase [Microlunatus sp. Gsoil 973]|uniref:SDR family NAD(P)-dependent oxidoreductase n=1 Tax=Microlunatus sp. Gsoil 973 TaxID=2672569 RepID=UPI0018A7F58E|nr:SDR family oxidoreductase [Microlunatus sp. Gsoil 973]
MNALKGKTAVVTGGGRGIGRAIAVGLAEQGVDRIGLIARSADQLSAAARAVENAGARTKIIAADLSRLDGLPTIVDDLTAELGGVDVLINNAAVVAPLGPTTTVSLQSYLDALALNVVAVAGLSALLIPGMRERAWGRIVNVSSGVAGHPTGMIGGNAYAASKAALEAHSLNLSAELSGSGVTVNIYRPGIVDTAMQGWIRDQDPAVIGEQMHGRFHSYHESGLLISPEASAAKLIARVAGEESGQIWDVNDDVDAG